jgi:hypothetical protein
MTPATRYCERLMSVLLRWSVTPAVLGRVRRTVDDEIASGPIDIVLTIPSLLLTVLLLISSIQTIASKIDTLEIC